MEENIRKNNQPFWHNFFSGLYLVLIVSAIYYLDLEGKLNRDISLLDFILLVLATFRLIRLFVYDLVMEHLHDYLEKYSSGYRKELYDLINCPWCTGIWAGLFIAFLFFLSPLTYFFILALAISGLGSFVQIVVWKIGLEPEESSK